MTDITPPGAPDQGEPAVLLRPQILTQRRDFIAASHGRRQGTPGVHLQGRRRDDGDVLMRVGYTCSKKVGNAVARNRAKRRLREVARLVLPVHGRPGWDYVLVGRPQTTASIDFVQLQNDLIRAIEKVHG